MRSPAVSTDPEADGGRRILFRLEWTLLLFGLVALDVFIWIKATSCVYEVYEDWAFDQDLRGLAPSPLRFAGDQVRLLFGRERPRADALQPRAKQEEPGSKPPEPLSPSRKSPAPAEVVGRLQIPNLHLTAMVREGADARTLRLAVGHIPGTSLPGARGNVGLAGHRDTFFRALRNIQIDDRIEFQTGDQLFHYQVRSTHIVSPRDVGVLASTSSDSLTLVTCYPFYYVGSAPKRFIVRAALVSSIPRTSLAER